MQVDAIFGGELAEAPAAARRAEQLGCDGMMLPEVAHDPFLPAALAATATTDLRLATGIAVAFARNPMTVAVTASDLQRLSGGRFTLGLGSQIKAHVTRRFSMPWSSPVPRMREFVGAVRSIWACWEDGTPLDVRGEHYQHTLMTPMFTHGPSPCGWPPIWIAAVGPAMTALAGEVADGLLAHGFTTADYVRDVTIPQLSVGLERAGRARGDVEVSVPVMLAVVEDDDDPRLGATRATIAFYGSTPAYRSVLEHHGWAALGEELHALSRAGDWAAMAGLVDDDVLHAFAVVGGADQVAAEVGRRFGGLIDRIQVGVDAPDEQAAALVAALHDL